MSERGARGLAILLVLIPWIGLRAEEPVHWGINAQSTLFENCVPFFCQGGGVVDGESAAQSFGRTARSEATAPFGTASMEVELIPSGRINLPRFVGRATTTGTKIRWCNAIGTAIEGYRYTGPTNAAVQFAFNLRATSTATNTWDGVKMELYLCRAPGFRYSTDLGWLVFESGIEIAARQVISVQASNGDRLQSGILELSVDPGERFYLVARCSVGIFQVDGLSELLTPAEVTCLNPEWLVSESQEDVPLKVDRAPDGVRVSWRPTLRPVQLQRASALDADSWLPVVATPVSTDSGSSVGGLPLDGTSYFRLKFD